MWYVSRKKKIVAESKKEVKKKRMKQVRCNVELPQMLLCNIGRW